MPSGDDIYAYIYNSGLNSKNISDGTTTTSTYQIDSLTNQKYISNQEISTPSGLKLIINKNISYEGNKTNPSKKIVTNTINSKTTTITNNYKDGKITTTTPMGKVVNLYYDTNTLLSKKIEAPSLYPIEFNYNQKGLLTTVTMGDRVTTYTYNSKDFISSITNPNEDSIEYEYDIFLVPIVPDGNAY